MFLNIILTILTTVLITITVFAVIWWKKYGKKLFETIDSVKNLSSIGNTLNQNQSQPNLNELIDRMSKLNEMFGKKK